MLCRRALAMLCHGERQGLPGRLVRGIRSINKKETESWRPKIRKVWEEGERKKPTVWLLISAQKTENRDYVRASARIRMLLFVITTSEMLVPLISLSGVA